MKIIFVSIVLLASTLVAALGEEAAREKISTTVIRHSGSFGLGEEGSLLEIVFSENGQYSWSLTWLVAYPSNPSMSQSVTITKEDYLRDEAWFAFVESTSRVWFFDGIDELMLAERTQNGISQQYAIWRGEALTLFDRCPPEVIGALPDAIPTK